MIRREARSNVHRAIAADEAADEPDDVGCHELFFSFTGVPLVAL
jgi:hypothetical protein